MMKKLKLRIESLAVDSFRPDDGAEREPGTVHGQAECTYFQSCLCKTAYYNCGTGPYTIYSCNYTNDYRCGRDTSFEACATPPELA
jgi:hypothetical protein